MWPSDPRRRAVAACIGSGIVGLILVALSLSARLSAPEPTLPAIAAPAQTDPQTAEAQHIDPTRWPSTLVWSAPVTPQHTAPPPLRATLLGILEQGSATVALIQTGDGETRRVHLGERIDGYEVLAIETDAVVLGGSGPQRRLSLR